MAICSRRARVFAPLGVLAAFIVGFGATTTLAHDMHVAITEINYHPLGHIDDQEFVELYNRGTEAVDLSAWRFNQGIDFVFPSGTILQPGAYLVVARNAGVVASLYGISNVLGPFDGKLANEGEMIQLVNSKGVLIERIHYDDEDPWTGLADGEGPTLERISTQEAGDRPWNWADSRMIGGTPGQPNSVNTMTSPPRDVVVNEVSSSAGGGWIELYNRSSATIVLDGYGLTCEPFRSAVYTISGGASIPPGGHWTVGKSALPFPLPDNTELHIVLLTPDGRLIDSLNFQTRVASGSSGRFPDGSDNTYVLTSPTRDAANTVALNDSVVINEIMYHPAPPTVPAGQPLLPYDRNEEYLELHNRTGAIVDLTGWSLTDGVDYDFPTGTQIAAHGYLVVARDPATVMAKHGLTQGVVGGYTNVLADGHERLTLRDTLHNPVDEVTYADDGSWPTSPDGQGPSLELINADMENNAASAWRPSAAAGGTPGAPNSTVVADPPPVIRAVCHNPPSPTSSQQVTVTAQVTDPGGVANVRLWSVVDPGTTFTSVDMLDDGAHGDGAAGDGVYGATLPARAAGSIVRFYVEAADNQAHNITAPVFPPNYTRAAAGDPTFLYQVDNRTWSEALPLYRVIMTAANLNTLRTRDLYSNVDLDGTFVCGNTIIYNVGVRYRGQGSRTDAKKSFRIQFHDEAPYGNLEDLNLNAHNPHQQYIGQEFFSYVNLPVHRTRVVLMTLNNDLDMASLPDPNTYVQVESVNETYLERVFGDDSGGNLYRADQTGDLVYLGTNPNSYRDGYLKETNDDLDDFTDIIALTNLLTNTPDAQFADVVKANLDIDEWMRYFAAMTVVTNDEGGICLDTGDDYYLYHRPSDGKWVLVPWDFDSVWDLSSTRSQPNQRIFRAGIADNGGVTLPIVRRILRHPDFAPIYYREIQQMMAYSFNPAIMADRLTNLRKYSPRFAAADIDDVASFVDQRRSFLDSSMPPDLTVSLDEASRPRVDYIKDGDTWKFFRGTAEPSTAALAWTQLNFADSAWESGPSGFGYGDNDDRTVLNTMQNNYTCVYIRKTFTIADLSAVPELVLSVWYDDGFVAYINGKEVARRHVNGTVDVAVPRTQTANADHEASDFGFENISLTSWLTATNSPFVQGENVLAIQGLNKSSGSSDFSLLPLLYVPRVGPEPARIMHIADGAQWSFFRGRSEPSAQALAWTQPGFAETGWESGASGFGYGDNDDTTVLNDMQNNYLSVYIRRKFTISDLAALTDLRLDVSYDDGFIAYINGKEVKRASVAGTVDQPVAYNNEQAASDHEASGFQSFDLTSLLTAPNTPLHAGENVLALHGINASLGSSDFTLRPTLSSSGPEGSIVQNCGSGLVTTAETLHITGVAPAGAARWVQVNGQMAAYLPVSWDNNPLTLSAYTAETTLAIGPNDVEIVALNADFAEVARRQVNIVRAADTSTAVSGTLAAATLWTAPGGPYHVTADVIVPAGGVLNIEPGTSVLFDANAALIVQGRLQAVGTAAAPIRFQPSACGQTWTGIVFVQAQGESLFDHCEIFDAAAPTYQGTPYTACLNAVGSMLRVQNCQFERMGAGAIDAAQASSLVVLDSTFKDVAAGIHAANSYVLLEGLDVQNVTGTAAAIACEGEVATQSAIRGCVLNLGAGDGVRLVSNSALVEGNTITAMAGKGMLLQGVSAPLVRTNIIAACPTGIALGDSVTASISHCTVVGGQVGVDLYAMTAGQGGGHATMDSTIIWGPSIAGVRLDAASSMAATTSDIAGGFAGAGNIAANPFFVDVAAGNYYLAPNSPCVGTGAGGTDMGALPVSSNPVFKIAVNEWMAKNTLLPDPQGELDDWFELYNAGTVAVNLGGLYLSDHANNPGLWRIPAGTVIPAKGFLLFWADRDVNDTPGLHADFALDINGEEIGLYLLAGNAYHTIDRVTFGQQTADISMGRTTDGSTEIAALPTPTPGRSNNPAPPLTNGNGLVLVTPPRYLPGVETPIRVEVRTPYGEVDRDVWTGTIELSAYPTDVVITPNTLEVVNGMASGEITLSATGPVRITVAYGQRQATVEVTGLNAPTYTTVSGTLAAGSTTWGPANGIVRITGDLTIPVGATLNVQPGTIVQLGSGVDLNVSGTLQSAGTLAAPVIFSAADPAAPWGQMLCAGSSSTTNLNYTFLTRGGNSPNVGHTTSGPTIRGSGGATLHLADSSFIDEFGKGMYIDGCHMTIDRCLLSRMVMGLENVNTDLAIADSFWIRMQPGGDATDHDALYLNGSGTMTVRRTVFAHSGDEGIDTLSSTPLIERCIVYGCEDKAVSIYSGTVRLRDSLLFAASGGVSAKGNNTDVYLDNCTIYNVPIGIQARDKFGEPNNIIRYFVNDCIVWAATQTVQTDYAPAYITISNSLLDPSVPWAGTGNQYVDPQFRNPATHDFRLSAGSPGVNTGDAAFVPAAGETDLDGRQRVLGGRVDRGAYEFAATYGDGDADGDGDVDMTDFAHFQLCVTGTTGATPTFECRDVDFNADGRVDGDDLLLFAKCFQGPTVMAPTDCARP